MYVVWHASDAIQRNIAILAHPMNVRIEVTLMCFADGALVAIGADDGMIK